jgi:predicted MFS family arabinose efflux permease
MLTGFIGMLYLNTTSSYWLGIGIPMMLIGFGQGLVMSPLTNLGIQEVRPEDSGAASGVVNAAHQIGCSVGLSVMVACTTHTADMVAICHTAMLIGFIFTLLSFITIFSSNYKSNN